MGPFEEPKGRGARLALVAGALLVLLAIVALASRTGFGGHSRAAPTSSYASYAFTVFLILFALMIPVAAYAFLIQMRETDLTKRPSLPVRMLRQIAIFLLFGAVGFVIVYVRTHHGHLFGIHVTPFQRPGQTGSSGASGGRAAFEPTFEWTVLWIAVVLSVVAAIGLVITRRRRPRRAAAAAGRPRSLKSSRRRSATRSTISRPSPTRGVR